jgi:hypothetical protein
MLALLDISTTRSSRYRLPRIGTIQVGGIRDKAIQIFRDFVRLLIDYEPLRRMRSIPENMASHWQCGGKMGA